MYTKTNTVRKFTYNKSGQNHSIRLLNSNLISVRCDGAIMSVAWERLFQAHVFCFCIYEIRWCFYFVIRFEKRALVPSVADTANAYLLLTLSAHNQSNVKFIYAMETNHNDDDKSEEKQIYRIALFIVFVVSLLSIPITICRWNISWTVHVHTMSESVCVICQCIRRATHLLLPFIFC